MIPKDKLEELQKLLLPVGTWLHKNCDPYTEVRVTDGHMQVIQITTSKPYEVAEPIPLPPPSEHAKGIVAGETKCEVINSKYSGVYPGQEGLIVGVDDFGYAVSILHEKINSCGGKTETELRDSWFHFDDVKIKT